MTQGDGGSSERTFSSVNVVKGLMHLLSSLTHSANWCGLPSCGGLATLAQCCRAFCICQGLLRLLQPKILCAKPWVQWWQMDVTFYAVWGWQHCVIVAPLSGIIAHLGHMERCPYLPHKHSDVSFLGNSY